MNLFAIFSKTGKGVQEASGKTSHLSRADRNVLKEIDGKTSLATVSAKFDKIAADKFEALIQQLDKDGYIREVSSGVQEAPSKLPPRQAAHAAKAPPPKADDGDEALDFTQAVKIPAKAPAAPSGPKPPPMDLAAAARADADRKAKEDQSLDYRSRQEMQAKAKAEADSKAKAEAEQRARALAEAKARADAEAKARAEAEAKARADAEARTRAEAEAKVKAAREAAVRMASEARAKSDAAEQRARDAERRAAEAAEVARKEVEEKAKRDAEELRQRLEAEMKAKLEEERKAREAEDRKRREEEDRRRAEEDRKRAEEDRKRREEDERRRKEEAERRAKEDAERKAREEEDRKRREADERRRKEEDERRAKEDAERKALEETNRKIRAEEERKRTEEERKRREEDERRAKEEAERRAREESERRAKEEAERRAKEESERRAKEEAERKAKQEAEAKARAADTAPSLPAFDLPSASAPAAPPPPPPAAAAPSSVLGDDLLADLDSFGKREEEEQKAKEEAERKAKAEAERKAREAAERKAKEDAERRAREEAEKKKREQEERRAQEEAERKAKEDEERTRQEEAERKRKAQESLAAKQAADKAARAAAARPSGKVDDDIPVSDDDLDADDIKRDQKVLAERARKVAAETPPVVVATGRPRRWGKPIAVALFVLLLVGVGALHVMPVATGEYEKAASEALGTPVKIGSARLSVITGVEMKFENVSIGDAKIRVVRGFPEMGSLFGARKAFSRVELEGLSISQSQIADVMQGKAAGGNFQTRRVLVKQGYLEGPLKLPPLDVDAAIAADGSVQSLKLSGADKLVVTLTPKDSDIAFEISAGSLALPFVPALTLVEFGMKGTANRQGVPSAEWDGRAFDGVIGGSARIRWGAAWSVDGEVKARGVKVAVFAPALVSEGKIDGRATYSMAGSNPNTLYENAKMQGEFKIEKGVLGSFDLTRALQTGGAQSGGRTVFSELTGQGVYDKGTVQITNVAITAGAMNAGASLTIDPGGALSGRVVADVKAATQTLRATLNLSGKVQDPVIRK